MYRHFPGGLVVKNPPANAGDMRREFDLCSRKILHALGQLSPQATTPKPVPKACAWSLCLKPVPGNKRSHCKETPRHHRESPCAETLSADRDKLLISFQEDLQPHITSHIWRRQKLHPWMRLHISLCTRVHVCLCVNASVLNTVCDCSEIGLLDWEITWPPN